MNKVKFELVTSDIFCRGCLCKDRNVTPLGEYSDIFYRISQLQGLDYSDIWLCWECISILRRSLKFQEQINQAQILLQQTGYPLNKNKEFTLSTLGVVTKKNFDTIYESNCEETDHELQYKIEGDTNEIVEENRKVIYIDKNKVTDDNYDTVYESDFQETDINAEYKTEEEAIVNEKVNKEGVDFDKLKIRNNSARYKIDDDASKFENEIKREIFIDKIKTDHSDDSEANMKNIDIDIYDSIKPKGEYGKEKEKLISKTIRQHNYRKKATITKNDIEIDNIDNYFTKCTVNVKIIEDILERRKKLTHKKSPRFVCKICKIGFQQIIDMKRHQLIKHPPPTGPYKCTECQHYTNIPTMLELHEHWRSHTVYVCNRCPEVCKSRPEMNRHLVRVHQFTYRCNYCEGVYGSFREFIRHYKDLHQKMICDHCGKTFVKKRSLETHIKRHHLPPICYKCGLTCRSVDALHSHSRRLHPELYYDLSKTELSYCVECDKQFASVYAYRRHLNTAYIHRPPKPVSVPCPECGKVFSRKNYMNNHYKLFHAKKSRHYCELCDKYYVTGYALRNHRLRVHEKTFPPKNKICEICGRGFSTNRVLLNHTRTHTGERPYKCSQCPAAFAQLCAKKSHERSQHKIF